MDNAGGPGSIRGQFYFCAAPDSQDRVQLDPVLNFGSTVAGVNVKQHTSQGVLHESFGTDDVIAKPREAVLRTGCIESGKAMSSPPIARREPYHACGVVLCLMLVIRSISSLWAPR